MKSRYRVYLVSGLILLAIISQADPLRLGLALPRTALSSASSTIAALDNARASGATQIRIPADWSRLEPRKGEWNFTFLDTAVRAAQERKLTVVLVFGPATRWSVTYLGANPSAEEVSRAHPNLAGYRAYVEKVVRRYQPGVTYYQVWERPSSRTLLAFSRDVIALYKAGAGVVHAVNPSLRVIAVEPGDVDLSWIRDYLKAATGLERADILAMAPIRSTLTPRDLAWHLQVLRQRVLPRNGTPVLWLEMPVDARYTATSLSQVTTALFAGLSTVTLAPVNDGDAGTAAVGQTAKFLGGIRGLDYRGWVQPTYNITAGQFDGQDGKLLVLPLADGALNLTPSRETPPAGRLFVAEDAVTLTLPGEQARKVPVTGPIALPLRANVPVLLSGVQITPSFGQPDMRPVPVRTPSVTLDLTGSDPTGIHALRDLPGGRFSIYTMPDGHTALTTGRNTDPWIYFSIPDGFLFYNIERIPIDVTVRVYGAASRQKDGFVLYYDAVGGMRTSPWQWIDVGRNNIFTYTVRLNDAIFAGREGYDLRLDMGGSESSIRLVGITIRKVLSSSSPSAAKK